MAAVWGLSIEDLDGRVLSLLLFDCPCLARIYYFLFLFRFGRRTMFVDGEEVYC